MQKRKMGIIRWRTILFLLIADSRRLTHKEVRSYGILLTPLGQGQTSAEFLCQFLISFIINIQ